MSEPLLRVDDLVGGYVPEVDILKGVNLTLQQGELVGIIGPNGAGKSTLVKAIFGLLQVRSGTVTYRGDNITGLPTHELVTREWDTFRSVKMCFPRCPWRTTCGWAST